MEGSPALKETIEPDVYIAKMELKDARTLVPVHLILSFEHKGKICQYRTLPFKMSMSTRIFMRFAPEPIRKKGIRLVYYLDDVCLLAKTGLEPSNCEICTWLAHFLWL